VRATKLNIGDLVQHLKNKRFGIVMSPSCILGGDYNDPIVVCKVTWVDTYQSNLMHVELLKKTEAVEVE